MILPWGKYCNRDLEDVPSSYLYWLATECDNEEIAEAADQEYQWRETNRKHF